jgi:hypothetical protein
MELVITYKRLKLVKLSDNGGELQCCQQCYTLANVRGLCFPYFLNFYLFLRFDFCIKDV